MNNLNSADYYQSEFFICDARDLAYVLCGQKYLRNTRSSTFCGEDASSDIYVYTLYIHSTCFQLDLSLNAFRAVSHPVCPRIRVSRVLTATSEFPKLCRAYKHAR